MEGDASGANPGENGIDRKFVGFDRAGIFANGVEGVGIGAGDERLAVLLGPTRRAKIGIDPAGEPVDMKHAPFDGIDRVNVVVDGAAEAGGMRIKGVRGEDKDFWFAGAQGAYLGPGGIAGQIAIGEVEDDDMAVIDVGFHAGNEEDAALSGVGISLGIGANLAVPGDGDGVEADFLGAVDVLDEVVSQVRVNRIALGVAVEFNAVGGHGFIMG